MNKIIFKRFRKYSNHSSWQNLIKHTPNTYTRRLKGRQAHLQPLSHSWFLQQYWYLSSDSTTRALSWWRMPSCPAGTRVVAVPSFPYYFTKKKKTDRNRCIHTMQMREGNPLRPFPSKQMHKLLPHWNHRRGVRSWMLSHRRPAGRGGPESSVSAKLQIGKEHQAQEALGFWATGGPSTAQVEGEGRRKQANHMKELDWEATGLPRVKEKQEAPIEITWARTLLRKGRNLPLWHAASSSPGEKASHRGSVWPKNSE